MKTTPMHERWQEGRGLKVVNKTQELVLPKQTLDRIGGDGPKKALGSFFGVIGIHCIALKGIKGDIITKL